jgi:hypothetical protein
VNRTVSRRLDRLETQAALATPNLFSCRIRFIDPIEGLTRVIVLDSNGSREEPGSPEERELVRAELEARRPARK